MIVSSLIFSIHVKVEFNYSAIQLRMRGSYMLHYFFPLIPPLTPYPHYPITLLPHCPITLSPSLPHYPIAPLPYHPHYPITLLPHYPIIPIAPLPQLPYYPIAPIAPLPQLPYYSIAPLPQLPYYSIAPLLHCPITPFAPLPHYSIRSIAPLPHSLHCPITPFDPLPHYPHSLHCPITPIRSIAPLPHQSPFPLPHQDLPVPFTWIVELSTLNFDTSDLLRCSLIRLPRQTTKRCFNMFQLKNSSADLTDYFVHEQAFNGRDLMHYVYSNRNQLKSQSRQNAILINYDFRSRIKIKYYKFSKTG